MLKNINKNFIKTVIIVLIITSAIAILWLILVNTKNYMISYAVDEEDLNTKNNIADLTENEQTMKNRYNDLNTEVQTANSNNNVTRANLYIDNKTWETGTTNIVKFTIELDTKSYNSEMFVNPNLFIELPQGVESVNTAKSSFTMYNNFDSFINKKVYVATMMEKKYILIKLVGEQKSEEFKNVNTTIDVSLELNIKKEQIPGNVALKVYYQNNTETTYEGGKNFDYVETNVEFIEKIKDEEKNEEISIVTNKEETPIVTNIENETPIIVDEKSNNEFELLICDYVSSEIEKKLYFPGERLSYYVYVANKEKSDKENLEITCILPKEITINHVTEIKMNDQGVMEKTEKEILFDEKTRKLTIKINKIEGTNFEYEIGEGTIGYKSFLIDTIVNELPNNIHNAKINTKIRLEQDEKVLLEANEIIKSVSKYEDISVEVEKQEQTISKLENFDFSVKIMNNSLFNNENIEIEIEIPGEITLNRYNDQRISKTGEIDSAINETINGQNFKRNITLLSDETCYLKFFGSIDEVNENKIININVKINGEYYRIIFNINN